MTYIHTIITRFRSISIPEYLLYASRAKNADLIRDWIRYRKNEHVLPNGLKYTGWQTDKDAWWFETPLMCCIEFRGNEPIPEEFKYPNWQIVKNRDGATPLMLYIKFGKNKPIRGKPLEPQSCIPEEFKYPGWQTDVDNVGYIPVIYWIKYRKNEPIPNEFKYPGWETYKNDRFPEGFKYPGYVPETLSIVWTEYRKNEPVPEELKCPGWQTYKPEPISEHTWQMLGMTHRENPPIPAEMFY